MKGSFRAKTFFLQKMLTLNLYFFIIKFYSIICKNMNVQLTIFVVQDSFNDPVTDSLIKRKDLSLVICILLLPMYYSTAVV